MTADGSGIAGAIAPHQKFSDPNVTAKGERRARVSFTQLETLWINTGTLCNIECAHCYIASSPTNDRLAYISAAQTAPFLDEAEALGAREVGLTGGEPFMNPDAPAIMDDALSRGLSVLVLTNAMKPMMRPRVQEALLSQLAAHGGRLKLRVSLDHYSDEAHDAERGRGAFESAMSGLAWLDQNGFSYSVAGRLRWRENEAAMRNGFAQLFAEKNLRCGADPQSLILFPEMDEAADIPEISDGCWSVLGISPETMMCANARMVVLRKGAGAPSVLACTLIADDPAFELGRTLAESLEPVPLNHPHCARFCVLGGASCSG